MTTDKTVSSAQNPASRRSRFPKLAIALLLSIVLCFGALPGYLRGGTWLWSQPIPVENLRPLRGLPQAGIELPGWQTLEQQEMLIGGHKWSVQLLQQGNEKPAFLFLRPQRSDKSQPEVDWTDIEGFEDRFREQVGPWKTDSYRQIAFPVKSPEGSADITARFFRGWNQQQTFAVVQWYAWETGGSPTPFNWFVADRLAQLRRDRLPWVAVALKIPIEPLGDAGAARPNAESLAKIVQATLMADIFSGSNE